MIMASDIYFYNTRNGECFVNEFTPRTALYKQKIYHVSKKNVSIIR